MESTEILKYLHEHYNNWDWELIWVKRFSHHNSIQLLLLDNNNHFPGLGPELFQNLTSE